MKQLKQNAMPALIVLLAAALLVACTGGIGVGGGNKASAASGPCDNSSANVTSQQIYLQCITGQVMRQYTTSEKFPLEVMKDSAELANLRARLIRLNDPNRIGYVAVWNANGTLASIDRIRGKVSSTGSQMTNTENAIGRTGSGNDVGGTVVSSPGDDGSFGPEECQGVGIFYFLASSDALEEVCVGSGIWKYSDAPFNATTSPAVVVNASPTTPIPPGGSSKK